MDLADVLTQRFTDAIRKSFEPCPLIGQKWFKLLASDRPPRFRFSGARKLAKATRGSPETVVNRITENLDLAGLDVNVRVAKNWDINVFFQGRTRDLL